jgi:hypothetical protein
MYDVKEIIKKKKAREEYEKKLTESQNELILIRDSVTEDMKKELAVIEKALNEFRGKYKDISQELSLDLTVQFGIKPETKVEQKDKIKFDILQKKSRFDEMHFDLSGVLNSDSNEEDSEEDSEDTFDFLENDVSL